MINGKMEVVISPDGELFVKADDIVAYFKNIRVGYLESRVMPMDNAGAVAKDLDTKIALCKLFEDRFSDIKIAKNG